MLRTLQQCNQVYLQRGRRPVPTCFAGVLVDAPSTIAATAEPQAHQPYSEHVGDKASTSGREDPQTLAPGASVPAHLPLGSSRYIQRTRREARRLAQQVARLERRLQQLRTPGALSGAGAQQGGSDGGAGSISGGGSRSSSSLDVGGLLDFLEDPGATAFVQRELLQGALVRARKKHERLQDRFPCDIQSVAARLQGMSEAMELPMDLVLRLAARHEPLITVDPALLRRRLHLLSEQALRLPTHDAAAALAGAPELLAWPAGRLAAAAQGMWSALAARGLQPAAILQARPDILTQSSATVAAKLDALPATLGMSGRAVRQLVSRRPELLRRSPEQLRSRYLQLQGMLNIPPSFVNELVMAEPRVICLSAATVKAKFDALVDRYGAFSDDIVDMLLVDPEMLLNAEPLDPKVEQQRRRRQQLQRDKRRRQRAEATGQQLQQQQQQQVRPKFTGRQRRLFLEGDGDEDPRSWGGLEEGGAAATSEDSTLDSLSQQQQQPPEVQVAEPSLDMEASDSMDAVDTADGLVQEGNQQQRRQKQPRAQQQSVLRALLSFSEQSGLGPGQVLSLWQQQPQLVGMPAAEVQQRLAAVASAIGLGKDSSTTGSSGGSGDSLDTASIDLEDIRSSAAAMQARGRLAGDAYAPATSSAASDGRGRAAADVNRRGSGGLGKGGEPASASTRQQQRLAKQRRRQAEAEELRRQRRMQQERESGQQGQAMAVAAALSQPAMLEVILQQAPALLALSTDELEARRAALGDLLCAGSPEKLQQLLQRQPALLSLSAEDLARRADALSEALRLPPQRARQLASERPELLAVAPAAASRRLGALERLLGVPAALVAESAAREPGLLLCEEDELAARFDALAAGFGSFREDAVDVVLADPSVLMRVDWG